MNITVAHASGSEGSVLIPYLIFCFCLFPCNSVAMLVLLLLSFPCLFFCLFRVFPCNSVANASASSCSSFRGKCLCFLAQPSLTHPALKDVFCFRVRPWLILLLILLLPSVLVFCFCLFRVIPCSSVANASASFRVFPCSSVANAYAFASAYSSFRGKCLCFLAP
jgi:hypothetical protein